MEEIEEYIPASTAGVKDTGLTGNYWAERAELPARKKRRTWKCRSPRKEEDEEREGEGDALKSNRKVAIIPPIIPPVGEEPSTNEGSVGPNVQVSGLRDFRHKAAVPKRDYQGKYIEFSQNGDPNPEGNPSSSELLSKLSTASHNIYMDTLKRAQVPVKGHRGRPSSKGNEAEHTPLKKKRGRPVGSSKKGQFIYNVHADFGEGEYP